jgi:hypothetical protein
MLNNARLFGSKYTKNATKGDSKAVTFTGA